MSELLITADVVLPTAFETIEDGAVLVRDGIIAAVGRRVDVAVGASSVERLALGRAILTPGLVNAHTHLALGALGHCRPKRPGFADWITGMARDAASLDAARLRRGLREGAAETRRSGTTAVGDFVPLAAIRDARRSPVGGVRFLELIGFDRRFGDLRLPAFRDGEGLAPHAPYSTSADIVRHSATRARRQQRRFAVHVAESEEELEFVRHGTGPLRRLLEGLGKLPAGFRPPGTSPIEYLDTLRALGPGTLAVHATFATPADIRLLAKRGASVVTCPRSNLALTGRTADVPALLAAGVNVALGTDSLASSPTLSLLDEMRALREANPALTPETVLDVATRRGASALGFDAGVIARGRIAELAAFSIERDHPPAEAVMSASSIRSVVVAP